MKTFEIKISTEELKDFICGKTTHIVNREIKVGDMFQLKTPVYELQQVYEVIASKKLSDNEWLISFIEVD